MIVVTPKQREAHYLDHKSSEDLQEEKYDAQRIQPRTET